MNDTQLISINMTWRNIRTKSFELSKPLGAVFPNQILAIKIPQSICCHCTISGFHEISQPYHYPSISKKKLDPPLRSLETRAQLPRQLWECRAQLQQRFNYPSWIFFSFSSNVIFPTRAIVISSADFRRRSRGLSRNRELLLFF